LFCGVHGQGEGPEAVVVGALGMVEENLPGFSELVAFDIELVVEVGVVGYVEDGPEANGVAFVAAETKIHGGIIVLYGISECCM